MKKKIIILMVIILIFNFVCPCFVSLAMDPPPTTLTPEESSEEEETTDEKTSSSQAMTLEEYKTIADEGKVNIAGTERQISLGESDVGSATSKIGTVLTTISAIFVKLVSKFTNEGGFYYTESDYSAANTGLFTINSLIFGEYMLLNPKIYELSTDLNDSITPSKSLEAIDNLKIRGIELSRTIVTIALSVATPMIMFAIVRVVSSNKARDLAVWKKILARWALCAALLFFFQYILIALDIFADSLVKGLWDIRVGMEENGYEAFEFTTVSNLLYQLEHTGGVTSLAYAVQFVAIVIMQALFLVKYVVRFLAIILMYLIAPIIILKHSFDLMIGKNSDRLGEFFKNYIALVFIQPIHAVIYIIFLFSLSEMAIKVPFLGIILLYALYRAEAIIRAMFGWELETSIFSKE